MTWYIENNGEAKLIPEEVLKYKIENNEISGDTLVVNEEIGNWIPLKETQFWAQIRQGKENRINLDDFNHTQNQQAVIKNEKSKSFTVNSHCYVYNRSTFCLPDSSIFAFVLCSKVA